MSMSNLPLAKIESCLKETYANLKVRIYFILSRYKGVESCSHVLLRTKERDF
jgi:hypothetical protein